MEAGLLADAWALKQLRNYAGGKLIMSAWLNRGLTSITDLADWRFHGNVQELRDQMKHVRGAVSQLMRLEKVPDVAESADADRKALTQCAEENLLEGEKVTKWCLRHGDSQPIALPDWLRVPIDRTVSIWLSEKNQWDTKINKRQQLRGVSTLPPAQNKKYQEWVDKGAKRRILMNKKTHGQILKIDVKKLSAMKDLMVLTLHLSSNTEDLKVECATGKMYGLALLQGTIQCTTLPADFEAVPGPHMYITYVYIYIFMF